VRKRIPNSFSPNATLEEANQGNRIPRHMTMKLRTPLHAILGFSRSFAIELVVRDPPIVTLKYAADIHQSGEHLLKYRERIVLDVGESCRQASLSFRKKRSWLSYNDFGKVFRGRTAKRLTAASILRTLRRKTAPPSMRKLSFSRSSSTCYRIHQFTPPVGSVDIAAAAVGDGSLS